MRSSARAGPAWRLLLVALCSAALAGCELCDREAGTCGDPRAVTGYGTSEGSISSSAILSINGSYGGNCALHANQAWSIALQQGAPLDHPSLEVAKRNASCVLSIVALRTGAGAAQLYTSTSPVTLGASYAEGRLFDATAGSLTASAKLSGLDFASTFVLTLLVSDDVQSRDAGASTHYAYEARVLSDGPLSYWRLDDVVPATIVAEDFTGVAGSTLQSRSGWTKHSASSTDVSLSNAGRARINANKKAVYVASPAPGSADYAVSADVFIASLLPTDQAGVIGRASLASETYYYAGLVQFNTLALVQLRRFELWKFVSGIGVQLAFLEDTPSAGTTRRISLEMVGTTLRASLDGSQRLMVSDNSILSAGSAGILLGTNLGSTPSETAGLHLDNLQVRNVARAVDTMGVNHGFYANGVTRGAAGALAVPNASASFDGVDDYLELTRQIGDDFSIELWFKSSKGLGAAGATQWYQTAALVDTGQSLANGDFGIGLRSDGKVLAGTGKTTCVALVVCSDDDQTIISSGSFHDGAWHHVVFTRSKLNATTTLYVDGGVQGSSITASTLTLDAWPSLNIGRLQAGAQYFTGSIDELAVYPSVLSAQSVLNHYRAGRY